MENEAWFSNQLRELLAASGWRMDPPLARGEAADFIAERGSERYAIDIKLARGASRRVLLEGLLSSAILRSRAAALSARAKPLAVVCARSISPGLLQELEAFARRFGEGAAWGAMDGSGLAIFHAPGLEKARRERRHVVRAPALAHRADFLSDLGQWMLKVLMSHRLPPELRLHAPLNDARIDQPISNAMNLARLADVSVASAARFVASLRNEHFAVDAAAVELIRESELLDLWRSAQRKRPLEVRARWLFSQKDPSRQLEELLRKHPQKSGQRACLALFAACERLGFRFVSGVAPHVYLEKVSPESMQQLGLRIADPGESADLFVREPRFPESVFRGCVKHDGVPVADVLQCWLDVAGNPARGEEMAAHLFDRVIRPSLLESD